MTKETQRLNAKRGRVAREVCVERILFEGDREPSVGRAGVVFDDGASFRFGCGGDGSVSIRKGRCSVDTSLPEVAEAEVQRIGALQGGTLERLRFESNLLVLEFSTGTLRLENADDELLVDVFGSSVREARSGK